MSPRRWGQNVQIWVYRFLVARDGEWCSLCGKIPRVKNNPRVQNKLQIDHINGNPINNEPDNLRLLCQKCNVTLENKRRAGVTNSPSPKYERERKEGRASTRIAKEVVNYSHPDSPATMRANSIYEENARDWILSQIAENGFYPKQDAIAGMAELVGCSTLTADRYLTKLTGPLGPLQEVKDMLGTVMLTWKPDWNPEPPAKDGSEQ